MYHSHGNSLRKSNYSEPCAENKPLITPVRPQLDPEGPPMRDAESYLHRHYDHVRSESL